MLDTNIIIYLIKRKPESVIENFRRHRPSDICISAVTLGELEYGNSKSRRPEQNRLAMSVFLSRFEIEDFNAEAALAYGKIKADLRSKGRVIGDNDMMIAAQALSMGLTLVTNNTGEFERVDGLKIENWA